MRSPGELSFREFRVGLAATLKRVQVPGNGLVFVGAHRKPEAVVMSVSQYWGVSHGSWLAAQAAPQGR